MENKFKLKNSWLVIIGLVVFTTIFVWILLGSSITANNSFVINARNYYYLNYLPKIGLDQLKLQYSILPIKKDSKYGYYTYSLLGKFEKIDSANHLIYLKDKNDQIYAITYLLKNTVASPNLTFFTYQDYMNQKPSLGGYIEFNSNKPDTIISKFANGEIIEIQWEDFRTLNQILSGSKIGSEILIERDEVLDGVTQVINRYLYEN